MNIIHIRTICRNIHRDLSYFFSGVIIIYSVSGFCLNHKGDFNAEYDITQKHYNAEGTFPMEKRSVTKDFVYNQLKILGEEDNYTKHYFPEDKMMKVFIKGGSSLVMNLDNGKATYEAVKKRHIISALNRMHYNPNRYWTIFSDIFILSLLIITISGTLMIKGTKGLLGRGGIELIAGIMIPLLLLLI